MILTHLSLNSSGGRSSGSAGGIPVGDRKSPEKKPKIFFYAFVCKTYDTRALCKVYGK